MQIMCGNTKYLAQFNLRRIRFCWHFPIEQMRFAFSQRIAQWCNVPVPRTHFEQNNNNGRRTAMEPLLISKIAYLNSSLHDTRVTHGPQLTITIAQRTPSRFQFYVLNALPPTLHSAISFICAPPEHANLSGNEWNGKYAPLNPSVSQQSVSEGICVITCNSVLTFIPDACQSSPVPSTRTIHILHAHTRHHMKFCEMKNEKPACSRRASKRWHTF